MSHISLGAINVLAGGSFFLLLNGNSIASAAICCVAVTAIGVIWLRRVIHSERAQTKPFSRSRENGWG